MAANLHQKYEGHMDYNKFLTIKGSKCAGSSPSPGFSPPTTKTHGPVKAQQANASLLALKATQLQPAGESPSQSPGEGHQRLVLLGEADWALRVPLHPPVCPLFLSLSFSLAGRL